MVTAAEVVVLKMIPTASGQPTSMALQKICLSLGKGQAGGFGATLPGFRPSVCQVLPVGAGRAA